MRQLQYETRQSPESTFTWRPLLLLAPLNFTLFTVFQRFLKPDLSHEALNCPPSLPAVLIFECVCILGLVIYLVLGILENSHFCFC